ncbi:MAG: dienelactone hydrolase family protein [Pseudomonadota bacterium]
MENDARTDGRPGRAFSAPPGGVGTAVGARPRTAVPMRRRRTDRPAAGRAVTILADHLALPGTLTVPPDALGVVAFAHGSGSSRLSPRNVQVARGLNEARLGTLLFDLLTPGEAADRRTVFDVPLLGDRLTTAVEWLRWQPEARHVPLGLFGASTGAAAALWTAAELGAAIGAVVSRGGRPDLAGARLGEVLAPTLLVVGGRDDVVLGLNRRALRELRCAAALEVVEGATHLFEEPGALEQVAALASGWFRDHLGRGGAATEERTR